MLFKDKIIIVTGASGGIGAATAKYLAAEGAKVILAARSEDKIKTWAASLPNALAVKTDMRREDDIKNLVGAAVKKYGRIDIVVNNAGQGIYAPVEKINIDDFKTVMELNVYGALKLMQLVIPIMRAQGGGIIINVSSAVTKSYFPGLAAYSATKYALNAISFTARQELAADKIIVSTVFPKMTDTDFGLNSVGARPAWVQERIKDRPADLMVDPPEAVAQKIGELILSGAADISV